MAALSEAATAAAIAQLSRTFGAGLDPTVLASVLELHGGDVAATTAFLQAQTGDFVDQGREPNKENLPPKYLTKPTGWVPPAVSSKTLSHEAKTTESLKNLFLHETTFAEHLGAQKENYPFYSAVLLLLITNRVELSSATRGRVLAACWARKDFSLSAYLLTKDEIIGLPEILRAVKILDAPRRIRSIEKKIARLEAQKTAKPKTIAKLRTKINDIRNEVPEGIKTAVTGALARKIKKWASGISKANLEFFALQMPKEPWRELSDIVHFKPTDFQLEWFLKVMYGAPPPEDSLLGSGAVVTKENVFTLCKKFQLPYSYVRKQADSLSDDCKAEIASYERFDTVFWYYEELSCAGVDMVILERLKKGEEPRFSYGKLMERLLVFKQAKAPFLDLLLPIAQKRLETIKIPLEPPVIVYGDASYSMDVAIRTATIIGSLLTALTDADLAFFNVEVVKPAVVPRTIPQILEVATMTKADGMTAPACCLHDLYMKKKVVKFFIMVTDEIENIESSGHFFAQLFYKYYREVHPAKIIFVSFLEDPNQKGRMVRALENLGIIPLQFRLDSRRPDLTKLDTLLGLLSAETDYFTVKATKMAEKTAKSGKVDDALTEMNEPLVVKKIVKADDPDAKGKGDEGEEDEIDSKDIPIEFCCSITDDIMKDPVVASDGHTYEREALLEWFSKNSSSPITGKDLETKMVFPNYSLKSRIQEWKEAYLRKKKGVKVEVEEKPRSIKAEADALETPKGDA